MARSVTTPSPTADSDREAGRKLADGTRGLRLRVRPPIPSDTDTTTVALSFELKRPHLDGKDSISLALREYLDCGEPAGLSDAKCVELVRDFAAEYHIAATAASDEIW